MTFILGKEEPLTSLFWRTLLGLLAMCIDDIFQDVLGHFHLFQKFFTRNFLKLLAVDLIFLKILLVASVAFRKVLNLAELMGSSLQLLQGKLMAQDLMTFVVTLTTNDSLFKMFFAYENC